MSGQSRPPHQHRLSVTIQWQNLESNVSNSRVLSVITISHHLSWKLRCWNNSSVLPGIKFHHGCNVLIHDTGWKEKTPATENPCTGMIASTRIHKRNKSSLLPLFAAITAYVRLCNYLPFCADNSTTFAQHAKSKTEFQSRFLTKPSFLSDVSPPSINPTPSTLYATLLNVGGRKS